MAMQISKAEVVKLAKKAEGLQNRAKKALEKADEAIEKVVRTAELAASAFAFGLVSTRFSDATGKGPEIVGVPVELAAGLGLHVLGFMGIGGAMNSHLHSLGDGGVAAYAVMMGRGAGAKWKEASAASAKGSGDRLSSDELNALSGG